MSSDPTPKWMNCSDFASLPGANCCASCHQDEDYDYELMEYDHEDYPALIPEGAIASVCCRMGGVMRNWTNEP